MNDTKVRKILVVDNDLVFLSIMTKFLKKEGYEVITAGDGASAIEVLRTIAPDLIFLDLIMPNIGGERLCRMIREMDTDVKNVFIIIITAMASEGGAVDYIGMGADDCISKGPFDQMREQIKNVILNVNNDNIRKRKIITPSKRVISKNIVGELFSINKYLETIISNITDGILTITEEGKIIYANRTAISILGICERELISTKFADLFQREDQSEVLKIFGQKRPSRLGKQARKGKGPFCLASRREVTLNIMPIPGEKEYIIILNDVTESNQDKKILLKAQSDLEAKVEKRTEELKKANRNLSAELTERKRMETMLQQSRNTLRSVFDNISDPLLLVDNELRIIMANRSTLDYFNCVDYLEILGKHILDLIIKRCDIDKFKKIQSAVINQEELSFESNNFASRGKWEKIVVYPILDEYFMAGSAIIRISDVTKEKIFTSELIQKEKLSSLGLLISSITHEINNPNNFILFNLPILKDYLQAILPIVHDHSAREENYEIFGMSYIAFHEDILKLVTNIKNGADRINTTVSKLMSFSRKSERTERTLVEPGEVIEKAISICKSEIKKTIKTLDINIEEDLPAVMIDTRALEQVIVNLLINASQAADKTDSWIKLRAFIKEKNGNYLTIEIIDNGCGMDNDTKERIFFPFFTSRRDGTGTGLGLYVVKEIVQEMEGEIEVQSELGEGSRFSLYIPLLDKAVARSTKDSSLRSLMTQHA